MDVVFNCIKGCVRSIFRENFDSAFEHLGKIDGQVLSIVLVLNGQMENIFIWLCLMGVTILLILLGDASQSKKLVVREILTH